jgi:hypothetical protein
MFTAVNSMTVPPAGVDGSAEPGVVGSGETGAPEAGALGAAEAGALGIGVAGGAGAYVQPGAALVQAASMSETTSRSGARNDRMDDVDLWWARMTAVGMSRGIYRGFAEAAGHRTGAPRHRPVPHG